MWTADVIDYSDASVYTVRKPGNFIFKMMNLTLTMMYTVRFPTELHAVFRMLFRLISTDFD